MATPDPNAPQQAGDGGATDAVQNTVSNIVDEAQDIANKAFDVAEGAVGGIIHLLVDAQQALVNAQRALADRLTPRP